MKKRYELITLVAQLGKAGTVAAAAAQHATPSEGDTLHGIWMSEIGPLNHVLVLRSRDDAAPTTVASTDLLGCADAINALHIDVYDAFPGVPVLPAGAWGSHYEIRTYALKDGGVAPTLEAWRLALPARTAPSLSSLAIALVARDGPARITHIWPYRSLEERGHVRAESVRQGVWPPTGAPQWLTGEMHSTIGLPTGGSPWH